MVANMDFYRDFVVDAMDTKCRSNLNTNMTGYASWIFGITPRAGVRIVVFEPSKAKTLNFLCLCFIIVSIVKSVSLLNI